MQKQKSKVSKDIDTMIPEAIIVKCLGVVLFRDKGWDSPNCTTCSAYACHVQQVSAFSKAEVKDKDVAPANCLV